MINNVRCPRYAALAGFALIAGGATWYAELSSLTVSKFSITLGGTAVATATMTSLAKSPTPSVTFTSSNPSVATVTSPKLVSMTTGKATAEVRSVAPGCSRITAAYGGRAYTRDIVVHPVDNSSTLGVTVPDQYLIFPASNNPGTIDMTLPISGSTLPGTGDRLTINRTVFRLSSSNTQVATVPDSVVQTSSKTAFSITGKSDGCAIITVKAGTQSVSKAVRVIFIGG